MGALTRIFILLFVLCAGVKGNRLRAEIVPHWNGETVEDLWREYGAIFPTQNRNGAAFKWSTFLLDRSDQMGLAKFERLFSSFCAVAAAIVHAKDVTRYRLTLPMVTGGSKEGIMYYCCWPCICDTIDFIRVDTKTLTLANGMSKQFLFAVIGNPCVNQEELYAPYVDPFSGLMENIKHTAPEIRCTASGELIGATLSDNGYIIMSMFHDTADIHNHFNDEGSRAHPGFRFDEACQQRADGGYKSGMGVIFRKIASANPITAAPKIPQPTYALASDILSIVLVSNQSSAVEPSAPLECPCSRARASSTNSSTKALP